METAPETPSRCGTRPESKNDPSYRVNASSSPDASSACTRFAGLKSHDPLTISTILVDLLSSMRLFPVPCEATLRCFRYRHELQLDRVCRDRCGPCRRGRGRLADGLLPGPVLFVHELPQLLHALHVVFPDLVHVIVALLLSLIHF